MVGGGDALALQTASQDRWVFRTQKSLGGDRVVALVDDGVERHG
jgi:hypothetical protein